MGQTNLDELMISLFYFQKARDLLAIKEHLEYCQMHSKSLRHDVVCPQSALPLFLTDRDLKRAPIRFTFAKKYKTEASQTI